VVGPVSDYSIRQDLAPHGHARIGGRIVQSSVHDFWGYNPANRSSRRNAMRDTCEKGLMKATAKSLYYNTFARALLCVLPVVILAQKAGADQNPPAPLGKLIDVGGYRVHLYCTGSGGPAVVIVGAGFSFNWGLVQPEVAKFAQVCSYDHSGIGWSDPGPADSCSLRANEVHTALKNAGIKGPYVMVGHSLGALVARIYAGRYPGDTAGIVFVDHASDFRSFTPGNSKAAGW
jgi:hypothetical protein